MKILLITPPLTQLNTPYPATAVLKGFLTSKGYETEQADLGIELVDKLFTKSVLEEIFTASEDTFLQKTSKNARQIFVQKQRYLATIEPVMRFLRGEDPTLATRICNGDFLPEASRFNTLADLDWAFGALGFTDRARHLATLYIEDLTDFIRETIDPHFELSRYAEHLCLYAPEFAPLEKTLQSPSTLIDKLMLDILDNKITSFNPDLVGFSIPFPGNLLGALKCGQYLKQRYSDIKIAWGGGYVNTELRELREPNVFDYTDYILFDDGEPALLRLAEHLENKLPESTLHKTFIRNTAGEVILMGGDSNFHIAFEETAAPDYSGLPLNKYISLIELANPMHKLWSDGRWNKLTLAHGCYWAKCAFCDTSLPYIRTYEPIAAKHLVDRIEAVIKQTGTTGFHFIDEAAPPKVLRELSEEIIQRNLVISWWTNVRFEKAFTPELCELMAKAGCIAVSGGIEVASNRLLKLMNKGVTIEQAAASAQNLTQSGIMVHAYLMYGFPTETEQETIDALEIVRQLFAEGLIQSAFWHRYAMTVHSPSGLNPENYKAQITDSSKGRFANNEIAFTDRQNIDLDSLGEGLRKATFNYMHGLCMDWPVVKWFEKKVSKSTIPPNYLRKNLNLNHN
ncbi:MAG: radical SAM protein [Bacteroidota bacterium]|nr:radical SAM protein [Bacteroidota bacterium]